MIKAVFFDFFNTLVYFDPPREKHYADTAAEFGVRITPEAIAAALPEADAWWRSENFISPIKDREQESKFAAYRGYGLRILRDAENTVSKRCRRWPALSLSASNSRTTMTHCRRSRRSKARICRWASSPISASR